MVKVKFMNLLRSKYGVSEIEVNPGTIHDIFVQILHKFPMIKESDLYSSMVFNREKVYDQKMSHIYIPDHEEVIITHFVGGG